MIRGGAAFVPGEETVMNREAVFMRVGTAKQGAMYLFIIMYPVILKELFYEEIKIIIEFTII
jgi:hypothetical protein